MRCSYIKPPAITRCRALILTRKSALVDCEALQDAPWTRGAARVLVRFESDAGGSCVSSLEEALLCANTKALQIRQTTTPKRKEYFIKEYFIKDLPSRFPIAPAFYAEHGLQHASRQ